MSVISLFLILLCGYALAGNETDETKKSKRGIPEAGAIPKGHGQPSPWKGAPAFELGYGGAPGFLLPGGKSDLLKTIPVYITKHVVVEKPVPVPHPVYIENRVPIPFPKIVHQPVPVPISVPQAVPVPVKQPVAVPVYQPYPVPVKQNVPIPVPVPVPVPVNAVPVPIIGPGPVIGPGAHHDPPGYGGGPFPHSALHGHHHPFPPPIVHGFGVNFGPGPEHGLAQGLDNEAGQGHGYPAFLNAQGQQDQAAEDKKD